MAILNMDIDKEIEFLERWTLRIPIGGLILCLLLLLLSTGCSGTWVWQEDYPKHRTMSLNARDGTTTRPMTSFIIFMQLDNMNQSKLMTRSQVSEELLKRGYTKNEYVGVWDTPDGGKAAWFSREKRKFRF